MNEIAFYKREVERPPFYPTSDACRKTLGAIASGADLTAPVLLSPDDKAAYAQENPAFIELLTLLLAVYESGRDITAISEKELEQLNTLAEGVEPVAAKAKTYITAATGKEFYYPIYQDDVIDEQNRKLTQGPEELVFNLFPNPARESVIVKVLLPETIKATHIEIYDPVGRVVKRVELSAPQAKELEINTATLRNGSYICALKNSNEVVRTVRFTVLN